MARLIKIYDTTLRDGTQGEGVSFSMEDKVRIAQRLDALGIHYIEGGWPGSNPKDLRFFRRIQDVPLKHAKLAAFGATRRPGIAAEADANLQALVEAGTPVATIFGKSWDFHVTHALETTLHENLAMIARLGRLPHPARRGGPLRRRALLRRLQARTASTRSRRCGRPSAPGPTASSSATPTAARCPSRSPRSSAR